VPRLPPRDAQKHALDSSCLSHASALSARNHKGAKQPECEYNQNCVYNRHVHLLLGNTKTR
jgi:hypothetical protein